jgi:hypothetical protein
MTGREPRLAPFGEYKPKLFDLYTHFRYNELICHRLMSSARKVERVVKWSVVVLVAISLLTGSTSALNPRVLTPIWAVCNAIATLLAVISLILGSGEKQFSWLALSAKFSGGANEVEFFSEYVRLQRVTEDELLERWEGFGDTLEDLVNQGGLDLSEYANKNSTSLREELTRILKQENRTP